MGVNKDWSFKFIEKKTTDISHYYFFSLEIFNYIYRFFNKYTFKILNIKLYYNINNIKLYIIFYVSNIVFKKSNIKTKKGIFSSNSMQYLQLVSLNSDILRFKHYINLKYLKQNYKYFKHMDWFQYKPFVITYIFCRLNILKFIRFIKYKNIYFKYQFFLNSFFNKLLISLKRFFNNKCCVVIVFKQLMKNRDSSIFLSIHKQLLTFSILKLRKFDKLIYFNIVFNLLYYCLRLKNKAILISDIVSSKLPNIKAVKSVHNFFKFIENVFNLFLIKLRILKGLKLIFKGNLTKNKRATKLIITVGDAINNSKINNNLSFDKVTCFTAKGTLGIKTYILN